jgi:hypothetical protein
MKTYRGYGIRYRRVTHSYEVTNPKGTFLGHFKTRVEAERFVDLQIPPTERNQLMEWTKIICKDEFKE